MFEKLGLFCEPTKHINDTWIFGPAPDSMTPDLGSPNVYYGRRWKSYVEDERRGDGVATMNSFLAPNREAEHECGRFRNAVVRESYFNLKLRAIWSV